jgi:hypothetical protein
MHLFDLCVQLRAAEIQPSRPAALLESNIGIERLASLDLLCIRLALICGLAKQGKREVLESGCHDWLGSAEHALTGPPNHNLVGALPKCGPRSHTYEGQQNHQDENRTHN